jgi:hypothetical protein
LQAKIFVEKNEGWERRLMELPAAKHMSAIHGPAQELAQSGKAM